MYCKQPDAWTRMGLKYGLLHAYTLLSVKTSGQAVKLQNKALSKTFPSASIIRWPCLFDSKSSLIFSWISYYSHLTYDFVSLIAKSPLILLLLSHWNILVTQSLHIFGCQPEKNEKWNATAMYFSCNFEEEFNAPLDLDSDPVWTWSDGGLYEGAVRFVKEQISFSGGKMKITVKPNPGHWAMNELKNLFFKVKSYAFGNHFDVKNSSILDSLFKKTCWIFKASSSSLLPWGRGHQGRQQF